MKNRTWMAMSAAVFILLSCDNSVIGTKPQRKNITELVFASGMLAVDDQYNLTAQTEGYLVKMNFNEGDAVKQGQLLAVIGNSENILHAQSSAELHRIAKKSTLPSTPALLTIKANMDAATAKLKLDLQQLDRYKRLLDNNSVSRSEWENVQQMTTNSQASLTALQQQYQDYLVTAGQQEVVQRSARDVNAVLKEQNLITALHAGRIYKKQKQPGDYLRKGDIIAVIGSPDLIYAKLNVDETNVSKLKTGQTVIIQLNTNKNVTYKAAVRQILPAFDEISRSFIVNAYFTQKTDFDIAGTQLEANIIVGTKRNALVIPTNYLSYGNKVTLKEGKKIVSIQPGIMSSSWTEVLSGVKADEMIVLTNQ